MFGGRGGWGERAGLGGLAAELDDGGGALRASADARPVGRARVRGEPARGRRHVQRRCKAQAGDADGESERVKESETQTDRERDRQHNRQHPPRAAAPPLPSFFSLVPPSLSTRTAPSKHGGDHVRRLRRSGSVVCAAERFPRRLLLCCAGGGPRDGPLQEGEDRAQSTEERGQRGQSTERREERGERREERGKR
eukprot:3549963-Rhodomonas_salina.2